jgi:hypothetical protein
MAYLLVYGRRYSRQAQGLLRELVANSTGIFTSLVVKVLGLTLAAAISGPGPPGDQRSADG